MQTKKFLLYSLFFVLVIGFLSACAQTILGSSVEYVNDSLEQRNHAFPTVSVEEIERQGNGTWNRDSFPLQVKIDMDISESRRQNIIFAMEEWNRVIGTDVFAWEMVDLERYVFYGQICEPEENTIFVFETELGNDVEDRILLGLTTNFYFSNQQHRIKSSLMQFDEDLELSDIQYVALHEFGHALGLSHDEGNISSVMYPHVLSSFGSIESSDVFYIRNQL